MDKLSNFGGIGAATSRINTFKRALGYEHTGTSFVEISGYLTLNNFPLGRITFDGIRYSFISSMTSKYLYFGSAVMSMAIIERTNFILYYRLDTK